MAIANGYITLTEFKAATSGGITGTGSDADIERAIEAASRAIDHYDRRRFWQDPTVATRYYTVSGDGVKVIVDDISTSVGLIVTTDPGDDGTYETTWTLDTDFRLLPVNASADSEPWTTLERMRSGSNAWPSHEHRIKVVAKFGWASTPTDIKQACLTLAQRLFHRRTSPFGVAGNGDFGVVRIGKQDNDVISLITPYRRVRVPGATVALV